MFRRREERREERPGGPAHYLMRQTLIFEDAHGREVWRVKDSMEIEGPDLEVQGNILDHEYRMEERGRTVAEVSKKWFRLADTYGVEVAPGQNDILILTVTVAVDAMAHEGH